MNHLAQIQLVKLTVDQTIQVTGLVQRGRVADAILDVMNYASCSYEDAHMRIQCIAAELDKE